MPVDDLKEKILAYRHALRQKSGHAVLFGEAGPVNMGIIDAMVAVFEAQEKRIELLEKRIATRTQA